ncbi:hypothetical protein [Thermomonospora cellulosilytica]|uniref:Uncharacterized protein n=1 Tax=Thermomonospora cellulosilytica TaxID=1411118 RepID=A0A7W3N1R9_9ACTN|nr:hypothetical protein [Thermomonospora cellulosilytica]MBA9005945.1 hypothetical protein [Thermomonospora cellulosilytica]
MDWVIPVRVGEPAEELRFALRSIAAHAPHDRIWLVGYRPSWAVGVEHIPTRQTGTKYQNSTLAVRVACEHPDISDPFILSNDDIYVMRPIDRVPVLHRGPVRDVEVYYARRSSGAYLRGMRETRDLLASLGCPDPLSYELHVPMPVDKAGMLAALEVGKGLDVVHKRTLYGNLAGLGGWRAPDVKVIHAGGFPTSGTFLSTMPTSWRGAAGRFVRGRFTRPSPYEQTPPPVPPRRYPGRR